jgi:hypothetical protein
MRMMVDWQLRKDLLQSPESQTAILQMHLIVGEMTLCFGCVLFWECVDQKPDFPPFEPKESSQMKNRFFSQEMASSSSHTNGIPLATLLEWYKIRDTFFGENCVSQNIPLALEMCLPCQHPDANWLTEACAGKDVRTEEDAKRVFSALGQHDARALCFSWMLGGFAEQRDLTLLRCSAELGFAFAQAWMAGLTRGEESFKFAQLAAAQGEREGFFQLGLCFRNDPDDLERAKENFQQASNLRHIGGIRQLLSLLGSRADRWRWRGIAAAPQNRDGFFMASRRKWRSFCFGKKGTQWCSQSDGRCVGM